MTLAVLVLTVAMLGAGCSNGGQGVVAGDGPQDRGGGTDAPARSAGGGEDGLFVSVEVGGGFVPVGFDFRSTPRAVIYDDGVTLSPAAVAAIYPGPVVLPLTQGRVDQERLRQLVTAAGTAGLLDDTTADFGDLPVADAPTTTVTVVVDGEAHVTSVYALGTAGDDLFAGGPPGLDGPQVEARQRVSEFVELVSDTVVDSETQEYVPERYRLLPLPSDQGLEPVAEPDVRDWPFPDVVLVAVECTPTAETGRSSSATSSTTPPRSPLAHRRRPGLRSLGEPRAAPRT